MNKMVSVIVPVYNCEEYLGKCMDSILKQTYEDLQVVVIDDGSTDSSQEIAERFWKLDKRVRLIHQENRGVSVARNRGLENSTGEYVLFVDADDYIDNMMVEFLVKAAEEYDAQIASCGLFIEESSFDHPRKTFVSMAFDDVETTILSNEDVRRVFSEKLATTVFHSVFAKLYRRDYIKQTNAFFDPTMSLGEDYLFNLSLFRNIDKYVYIGTPLYHYNRGYSNSTLSGKYRADMFEIELKLFNATTSQLNSWKTDRKQPDGCIYEVFFNNIHLVLRNEARPDNKSTKWEKLQRLRYITNQKEVRELTSQKSFRPKGYKRRLIFYFLKLKVLPLLLFVGASSRRIDHET
jgi:glycosyltransferase involved in cell wall biosynthesis